jgi:hypothetical protein
MPPEQESDCQKQLKGRIAGSKNHGADVWDVVVRMTSSKPYASLTQSAQTLLRRNGVLQSVDRKRDCIIGGKTGLSIAQVKARPSIQNRLVPKLLADSRNVGMYGKRASPI